jgi:hypothetical protein
MEYDPKGGRDFADLQGLAFMLLLLAVLLDASAG